VGKKYCRPEGRGREEARKEDIDNLSLNLRKEEKSFYSAGKRNKKKGL